MLNRQLSNMVLTEAGLQKVDAILNQLLIETEATYILLVEKSGQAIRSVGENNPHVMALSALIAGAFASTREIARLLGEDEFSVMFQQGKSTKIFITILANQDLLAVVTDKDTMTGLIKIKTEQVAQRLTQELQSMMQEDFSLSKQQPTA